MAFHLYKRGSVTGTFAQNDPLFVPALDADLRKALFNGIWSVAITPTTASNFEYSTDGGTTFFPLLSGPLPVNTETICNFLAQGGDLFQLRCPDIAGCTVFRTIVSLAPQDIQRRGESAKVEIIGTIDVNLVSPIPLPVDITGQPISVVFPTPVPVDATIVGQPISVDICPVTCEIDVDINSISFGTIPISVTGQPISVTETADPKNVAITGQPISVDVVSFLPNPLPVDICPVTCTIPVDIQNQPITVTQSANPLPVSFTQPISVDVVSFLPDPLPVSFTQPITVTQSANPLPVDICPVTCEIDVDINSISFGTIPVSITGQPISVTETADPQNVLITGQPIQIDIFAQSFSPLLVDICPVTCDIPIINGSVSPLIVSVANPVGTPVGKIISSLTNSPITLNTDIFAAVSPTGTVAGDAVVFRIQWSAQANGVLSYTLNNSDFVGLNDANGLKQDVSHVFDIVVDDPDLFTLQFDKTTTITFLRVIQLV